MRSIPARNHLRSLAMTKSNSGSAVGTFLVIPPLYSFGQLFFYVGVWDFQKK
jgi:hypothetical protein